ncbi:MAG: hypothetical protein Q4D60_10555 [Eubacteriales bacterium]|nr:hypothetical protein [Eubacteriales bacterium]
MLEKYDAKKANVIMVNQDAFSIMQKTPVETVKSILSRIGLEYEEGLPKEVYLTALKAEICADGEWLLKILPEYMITFLIEIWEKEEVGVTQEQWDYLEYLKIFGLADFKMGSPLSGVPNKIYVVQELRDAFYFFMKSRKSRKIMREYAEWEKVFAGLIYYYGMIDCGILYDIFMRMTKRMILYTDFISFIKCRCSLWAFGVILRDIRGEREYFQYINVENPEMLLLYVRENRDLPYKTIKIEDLYYVSESAGIDNRWKGVSELGNLCLDDLHMDYYQATVLIKTLILMVQNGSDWKSIKKKIQVLPFKSDETEQKVLEELNNLYENVPLFELKGYTRKEYKKLFHQKQLKKKREMFTLIEGKGGGR